eukprot:m.83684 g.83684  ORF g.83684 m.83684 type:complete len:237 (+) comp14355_c0_seq6:185-895(+)
MKRTAHHVSVPSSALRRGADATGKRKTLRGNTKTILLYGGGISLFVLFIFAIFYHHHSQGFAHFDRSTASGKVMALQDEQLIRLASKTSMRHFRNDLLKPFLVPRPVGSTNLRNVRKVSSHRLTHIIYHCLNDVFEDACLVRLLNGLSGGIAFVDTAYCLNTGEPGMACRLGFFLRVNALWRKTLPQHYCNMGHNCSAACHLCRPLRKQIFSVRTSQKFHWCDGLGCTLCDIVGPR